MDPRWDAIVASFDAEHGALVAALDKLTDTDYHLVTNCPPWDLRELVVHICFSACTWPQQFPAPSSDAVEISAADYYRRAERDESDYRTGNVDRTQRVAARFATGRDALAALAAAWSSTRERLDEVAPDTRIAGPNGVSVAGRIATTTAIRLDSYMITRLIALAAHAVDVALTLRRDPWTTATAAERVAETLTELLGSAPPASLGWSAKDLLLVGTGRRPLAPTEREQLGHRATAFPLLS
jgi:uncharacterized protein (TIGR03083 family)